MRGTHTLALVATLTATLAACGSDESGAWRRGQDQTPDAAAETASPGVGADGSDDDSPPEPDAAPAPDAPGQPDAPCPSWYPDGDGDGHGLAGSEPMAICSDAALVGMSATADDCADDDPRAYPGATGWQTTPIVGQAVLPWDFDCNSAENLRWPGPGGGCLGQFCAGSGPGDYWIADSVPGCGVTGHWVVSCTITSSEYGTVCESVREERVQGCR